MARKLSIRMKHSPIIGEGWGKSRTWWPSNSSWFTGTSMFFLNLIVAISKKKEEVEGKVKNYICLKVEKYLKNVIDWKMNSEGILQSFIELTDLLIEGINKTMTCYLKTHSKWPWWGVSKCQWKLNEQSKRRENRTQFKYIFVFSWKTKL